MLRINQLKLKVGHSEEQLKKKLVRELKIRPEELQKFEIRRQSIDARKKPELYYVYSIDVQVKKEKEVLKKHPKNVQKTGCVLSDAKTGRRNTEKASGCCRKRPCRSVLCMDPCLGRM